MKENFASNKELDLAWDFITKTDRNVFLTGKAGTGKTTFLHKIKEETLKRHIVVAPTGVAAINAKGTTIHSFFQMPFGPILPAGASSSNKEIKQRKFNKKKIDIIHSLDLLIIDEISMVRADLLDGIDQILRKYKNKTKAFGGVQVLMIGDLQQLAPVVKDDEWNMLKPYYETMYFFSSKAFKESGTISIELKLIFRQQNQKFIDILNEIRNNKITQNSIDELNKRYIPNFVPDDKDGYITLTTHNHQSNEINKNKLDKIKGDSTFFKATVEGDFSEHNYPTYENLELKKGAQVMFVKNDSDPQKRYFNGKIGKIVALEKEKVIVRCPGDHEDIITTTEIWDNITYSIDKDTKEIVEKVKGSFEQIPLKLAWAITIHKSQGLTFEKAVIDVKSSFTHGQTYVALSRCKTLEGMVLRSPIKPQCIIHDNTVTAFTKKLDNNTPSEQDLNNAEKEYQLNLIAELFDFIPLHSFINRALQIVYQNQNILYGNYLQPIKTIKENGIDNLIKIGRSFKEQLKRLSSEINNPQNDTNIQERITKGMEYFLKQIEEFIEKPLNEITFSTDNKAVGKDLKEQIKKFNVLLKIKEFCFRGLEGKFNTQRYMQIRNDALFANIKEPTAIKNEVKTTVNQKLFNQLRDFRSSIANSEDIAPFQVFTQNALYGMCSDLPTDATQLRKIKDMGKVRIEKYGDEIIDIIKDYCEKEGIDITQTISSKTVESKKEKRTQKKGGTQKISFNMYKDGLNIDEIAKKRELKSSTIESHLSNFVADGSIKLSELLGNDKSREVIKAIKSKNYEELTLSELRIKLDEKYSYGELKMALKSLESE
jgi:guanylate kinase